MQVMQVGDDTFDLPMCRTRAEIVMSSIDAGQGYQIPSLASPDYIFSDTVKHGLLDRFIIHKVI